MTPERMQRIEELYHAALARDASVRATFLTEACKGDEVLRREVEALLEQATAASRFFEAGVKDLIHPSSIPFDEASTRTGGRGDAPGESLGDYQLLTLLGAGGMGEVWAAHEQTLGRRVALKLLPEAVTRDPLRISRFEQEARAASALNHPNVAHIYALGQTADGQRYIAMELVEGETLRARLRSGHLPLPEAIRFAVQVAAALTAAHTVGVIHRDIKPENVMIRPDGFIKVLDFGLAKLVASSPSDVEAATRTSAHRRRHRAGNAGLHVARAGPWP